GPAISNLIAFTIYNGIRYFFLFRRFKMQPFTLNSLYTIVLAFVCYIVCYLLFNDQTGFIWITVRSGLFIMLFLLGMLALKLSDDVQPVFNTIKKRLGFRTD
ncbi:MAG TPA: hypothetical protein VM368_03320, partial [Flavisolibacter sp.]|nr:hypothetical protein [Flavisolibacter sp.]